MYCLGELVQLQRLIVTYGNSERNHLDLKLALPNFKRHAICYIGITFQRYQL